MAVFTHLETDTGTNVDISGATAVGAYTANGDKLIMVDVSIDAVAGNGDYVMYVTRQIGGSGSAYRILPQTTLTAASGLTAISAQSGWITVRNGDVLTVYVDGLAGDTSTPDWTTRWFELAGVTAASVADAVLDEATSGHTTAGTFGKAISDILADTGTDGVVVGSIAADAINAGAVKADAVTKIQNGLATPTNITAASGVELKSTQPTITWAQQKIVSNLSNNPALLISNNAANGVGLSINAVGNNGKGASINAGDSFASVPGTGLVINGATDGAIIGGNNNVGIRFSGRVKDVDGFDPDGGGLSTDYFNEFALAVLGDGWDGESLVSIQAGVNNAALEATLTDIKGAGWTNETLVALKNYVDELETRLTAARAGYLDKLNVPGTLANSNDANTYKADVSGLATTLHVQEVENKVDIVDTVIDNIHDTDLPAVKTDTATIKSKTDNLPASPAPANEYDTELAAIQNDLDNPDQYKADVSALAQTSHLQDVEDKLDLLDTNSVMSFTIDGFTLEQIVQIMAASLAGKLTRTGNTLTFRDLADTLDRIIAETDANKQRTNMNYGV